MCYANPVFIVFIVSIFLFALGAAVGSFVNVVLYRTVIDEGWVHGRSRCDFCKKTIRWFDNIPLLSYLILRGMCRDCQKQISLSHPVVELLVGTLFVWWYWGGSLFFQLTQSPFKAIQPIFWLAVGILLIMVFMADVLYLIIPDVVVGLLLVLTISYRLALTGFGIMQPLDLFRAVLGAVIAVGFFGGLWLITKGKGMGLGDVKLVAPLGLLLGWPNIFVGLFIAFVTGAAVGITMIALKKRSLGQVLPFGPFLIWGTMIALVYGDALSHWYLQLLK